MATLKSPYIGSLQTVSRKCDGKKYTRRKILNIVFWGRLLDTYIREWFTYFWRTICTRDIITGNFMPKNRLLYRQESVATEYSCSCNLEKQLAWEKNHILSKTFCFYLFQADRQTKIFLCFARWTTYRLIAFHDYRVYRSNTK